MMRDFDPDFVASVREAAPELEAAIVVLKEHGLSQFDSVRFLIRHGYGSLPIVSAAVDKAAVWLHTQHQNRELREALWSEPTSE